MSNINLLQDRTQGNEYRAVAQITTPKTSFPKVPVTDMQGNPVESGISTVTTTLLVDAFGNSASGATSSVTPVVATSQYTANTEVGLPMTFSGISGTIKGVTITIPATQTAGFNLYFFNPPLTGTYADKSAATPSAADMKNFLGVVTFSAPVATPGLTNATVYSATANIPVANAVSGVKAVLVTTGSPTFATNSSVTVSVQT